MMVVEEANEVLERVKETSPGWQPARVELFRPLEMMMESLESHSYLLCVYDTSRILCDSFSVIYRSTKHRQI
jgi:hypothetical protein